MFERFTDRARRVVVLAQEGARLLHHNSIGTEHILLGLVHEGDGVARGMPSPQSGPLFAGREGAFVCVRCAHSIIERGGRAGGQGAVIGASRRAGF